MKTIIFRVDSFVEIGAGHLMRCLVLADYAATKGCTSVFICRNLGSRAAEGIKLRGHSVHVLGSSIGTVGQSAEMVCQDVLWRMDAEETLNIISGLADRPSWLIVDHYSIDRSWEEAFKKSVDRIMVIDDLNDRPHVCDLYVNFDCLDRHRFREHLVPDHCDVLLGPSYLLLHPEFREMRMRGRNRDGVLRRAIVFYGESDIHAQTDLVLKALSTSDRDGLVVDVVIGSLNSHRQEILQQYSAYTNYMFHCPAKSMPRLMNTADIAFISGGMVLWEAVCMGLPSVVTLTAENQIVISEELAKREVVRNIGWHENVQESSLLAELAHMRMSPKDNVIMGSRARRLVDGDGCSRVIKAMEL